MLEEPNRERQCLEMLERGVPHGVIKATLKMSPKTIVKIARGEHMMKSGRPSKLKEEHIKFIEMNSELNACLTDQQLADMVWNQFGIRVSDTTILRVRGQLGFHYRPPKVKQALTEPQKELRLAFCSWVLANKESLPQIVFTDESRFCKGPDNRWRHIRRGQCTESCFVSKEKFTKSVMVWGGISMDYRTPLMMCSNNVDAAEYQRIITESGVIETMNEEHGVGKWAFMQDGASSHVASSTEEMLYKKKVYLLAGWPPNSPDLNPIEMIWGIMKRRANWEGKSAKEMSSYLQEIWGQLDRQTINQLVSSFFYRCELVVRVGGESVTPYLQSHQRVEGPLPLAETTWSVEEDQRLKVRYAQLGSQWTKLGRELGKNPQIVKHRYRQLVQCERNLKIQEYRPLPSVEELLAVRGLAS